MPTVTIPRFTVVQAASTGTTRPVVERLQTLWTADQPALNAEAKIMGVTMTDSGTGADVAVMRSGFMRDVAEQGGETWAAGDKLWAKPIDGSATNARPTAPDPQVHVGYVFSAGSGAGLWNIDVDVYLIPSLGELSGVSRETPVEKDVFIFRADISVWEPRALHPSVDVSGTYSVTQFDYLIRADATGGAFTVTLPPVASSANHLVHVKKIDSSAYKVTIKGDSSDLIDDTNTFDLELQGESLMMQCNGTSWAVL